MLRRRSRLPWWLEAIVGIAALALYRVRSRGRERIPGRGGVLVLANHLSYLDPVVLQMACPRPLRFVGYRGGEARPIFDLIFRAAGVISIDGRRPLAGMRAAAAALSRGEAVCLFPEGEISRTGQLMRIRRGYEVLARRAGAPVVPAAIDGMWGSLLSFSGLRFVRKRPRFGRTSVRVVFGEPLPADRAGPAAVRRALLDLGEEAFDARPVLRRHLGREAVRALARRPGRVVVIDRTAARRAMTAAQLLAAAAVLSRWLRREVPERRIGIVLPPGIGAMVANLGAVCAGKVPVNLNFTAGRPTIEASLEMAGIGTVLSADAMREKVPNFPWPERTFDLRAVLAGAGGRRAMAPWLLAAWVLPGRWLAALLGVPATGDRAEAALLFTSGSAGDPKGVVLTHRNLLANCEQVSGLAILPPSCTMLGCLPVFHSFGFTVTLWYPLLLRCGLVTVPSPLDTRRILDAIEAERVTVMIGAPTFLRPLLKKARPEEMRPLCLVVSGAEALPDELHRYFFEAFGLEIMQGYGLTESSPVASVNQPNPPVTTRTGEEQVAGRTGTVGRILPGMSIRILHPESGSEMNPGETGIIALKGANIFPGYLGHEAREGGWFATGDLGSLDQDGFLRIAGRLSRFSKIGGEMVPHGAVERALAQCLALDEGEEPVLAVTAVPDPAKGEALVVLAAFDLSAETVRARLHAAGLPPLWVPKVVVRVEKLPLLGSGKLDLRACREIALGS